jgi:glutamate racemase
MNNQPIGIFDSGIGGLTVAHAVSRVLEKEKIIYFGDTAHLPYGEKSVAAIQAYTIKICDFLLSKQCKIILIACNSASAAAYELAKAYVGTKAVVFNVIDPIVDDVTTHFPNKNVGLIGTRATINSKAYEEKITKKNVGITLKSLATPLLASLIEEGFFNNTLSKAAIQEYLSHPTLTDIDALILGCTHYPLIKKEIADYYDGKVQIIDGSYIVAQTLAAYLATSGKQTENLDIAHHDFYVSDYTQSFEASTAIFFGQQIKLQLHKLWE